MTMNFETETQFNSLGKRLRDEDPGAIAVGWEDQPKQRKLAFRPTVLGSNDDIFVQNNEQQLPFSSHQTQGNPHTPTLIPADSSSDSSNAEIRSPPLGPSVAVPSTVFTPADADIDMAMDSDGAEPSTPQRGYGSPMISPKSQGPSRSGSREAKQGRLAPIMLGTPNQTSDLSTRVPTPIYGHFSTHAGTADSILGSPVAQQSPGLNSGSPLPHHSRSNHYNIALYPHHLQERKMPSPISEDFAHEPGGGLRQGRSQQQQQQQHNLARVQTLQTTNLSPNAANYGADDDMAMSPSSPTASLNPAFMSRSPSLGQQRQRSDAISGSPGNGNMLGSVDVMGHGGDDGGGGSCAPTYSEQGNPTSRVVAAPSAAFPAAPHQEEQQRQKATFHMGFKADCKMCQDRVPGHFNHITSSRA